MILFSGKNKNQFLILKSYLFLMVVVVEFFHLHPITESRCNIISFFICTGHENKKNINY